MAARVIEVTPQELEAAAKSIEDFATDYQTQYKQLYSETQAMGSAWKGKDNTAFIDRIAGFEDDFKKMYDLMNQYADFLRKSAKAYQTTQDNVVSEAGKLIN